jgi:dUTP pyrophosphatase
MENNPQQTQQDPVVYWFCNKVEGQMWRKHPTDAGLDVKAAEDVYLAPGALVEIRTGLHVAIPAGYYGQLAARSGLALKHGVMVLGGVIDPAYRGEVVVIMYLPKIMGDAGLNFSKGNRIAQLILIKRHEGEIREVSSLDELGTTERGADGFGSSGVK